MTTDVNKFYFRLVLLGSNGTGKTSILNRFLFKRFETSYKPTVEDLFSKSFDLGNIEIKVDFLDTSGSMQFPAMRRLSITTGNAFLIVYAVDDDSSYEVLKMCINEIREMRPDYQEIPIVFAGNKTDIPRDKQKVRKEVVSNYVHYDIPRLRAKVIECSCKDSFNIDNIFRAYLSLARVSLSSAVSVNNQNPSHPSARTLSPELNECNQESNRRSSSFTNKVVLGVRKSCDASILFPMKNTLVGFNSSSNTNNSSNNYYNDRPSTPNSSSTSQHGSTTSKSDIGVTSSSGGSSSSLTREMNLEAAIQSKLNIKHTAKPRSRSLIWRPARKSRAASESSDCQVS